jgi:hypothetical protein
MPEATYRRRHAYTESAFEVVYNTVIKLLESCPNGLTRDDLIPMVNRALSENNQKLIFKRDNYFDSFLLAMCAVDGSKLKAKHSAKQIRYYLRAEAEPSQASTATAVLERLAELRRTASTLDYLEEQPNEVAFANVERFVGILDDWGWLRNDLRAKAVADGGVVLIWENQDGQWLFDAMNNGECMVSWIKPNGQSTFWLGNMDAIVNGFQNQKLTSLAA